MAYLGLSPEPDEAAVKREVFAPPEYSTELPMTPQQIEAAVKREQPAPTGGGLALAAIAAYLILGA